MLLLRAALFGVPVGITFVDCVGYIAKVEGVSMQPSLNPDPNQTSDFVFLCRWSWRKFDYSRGDVVSLISPKNPNQAIIKRVIGLEGDLVKTLGYRKKYLRVPKGHCWVEGDHTGHSLDSNYFGPIAVGLITAKASAIVWPPARWGSLESYIPGGRNPMNIKDCPASRVPSNVYKNAVTLGDFDNDGLNELIIGNDKGDLSIFKGENPNPVWVATDLGLITSVIVGDLTNLARNSLLVITSCGFCYIFDLQDDALMPTHEKKEITPVHFQRLPANIKMALIGDINGDGCFEVVVALTDRIVRTYKWVDSGRHTKGFPQGKLIGQNKWELSDQIGGIALNRSEGSQSLLVSQPGGTCFTLTPPNDSDPKQLDEELSKVMNKMSIEFESLDASTCNNAKIQTEICGDIELEEHDSFLDYTAAVSGPNRFSDSSFLEPDTSLNSGGTGYILATVDGLVMLVKNRKILWKTALKHPIISVSQLLVPHTQKRCPSHEKGLEEDSPTADSSGEDSTDTSVKETLTNFAKQFPFSPSKVSGQLGITGHSTPTKITIPIPYSKPKRVSNSKRYGQSLVTKIVVGAQDGTTFIMNLRDGSFSQFNFHDSVCCCTAGFYGCRNKQTPCIVYASYSNQIYLYHDVNCTLEYRPKLVELLKSDLSYVEAVRDLGIDLENREQVRQLNSYLMYGYNGQFDLAACK